MCSVINFNEKKKETKAKERLSATEPVQIELNIKEQIRELEKKLDEYGEDDMVDTDNWDGECFKSFLEKVCANLGEAFEEDSWDVFAVLIHQIFESRSDGVNLKFSNEGLVNKEVMEENWNDSGCTD